MNRDEMKSWRDTFLFRLFRADNLFFGVLVCYIGGLLYFTRMQREEFPFLLYAMYSMKEYQQESYSTLSVEINGEEVKHYRLMDLHKEMVVTPLHHALPHLSEEDKIPFKQWMKRYGKTYYPSKINRMDIYRLQCRYDDKGRVQVMGKELIYSHAEE